MDHSNTLPVTSLASISSAQDCFVMKRLQEILVIVIL